jgi:hypothetical protein
VGRLKALAHASGLLVRVVRVIANLFAHLAGVKLAEVSVVITSHLHVKDLSFVVVTAGDEDILEQVEHILTDGVQLTLNLVAVVLDLLDVLAAFELFSVLDGRDGSPGCTSAADIVLVGDRKQVSLLVRKLASLVKIHGEHLGSRHLPLRQTSCK